MTDVEIAKEKLFQDFSAVVADAELLLESLATAGGEKAQALRGRIEENVRAARIRLRELEGSARDSAGAAAKATDEYVRGHPWESIAVAAGVAAVAGVVLGLMLNRR
jgi:ElaB/YqjD/DUF883 family membrane-anchored ribosome-binding protein